MWLEEQTLHAVDLTDWAKVPAASAGRSMTIIETLDNKFFMVILLFIKTSLFRPNGY
jgi:hypothetical protein